MGPTSLRAAPPSLHPVIARGEASVAPDMEKRTTMNLLLVGAAALPVGSLGIGYAAFFFPKSSGGAGGGQIAKDALGNDVVAKDWAAKNPFPGRALVQGLKG